MVENMVEAMGSAETVSKRNKELREFYKEFGTLSSEMCLIALQAIKEGKDFYLTSELFRKRYPEYADKAKLSGKELKEWGLDLDALLCPEPKKGTLDYYARKIL